MTFFFKRIDHSPEAVRTDSTSRSNSWHFFRTDSTSHSNGWQFFLERIPRAVQTNTKFVRQRLSVRKWQTIRHVFAWEVTPRDWQNIFAMFINPYPSQINCRGKFLCFSFVTLLRVTKTLWKYFPMGYPHLRTEKLGTLTPPPPPSPVENQMPSVEVVWIFYGTTH